MGEKILKPSTGTGYSGTVGEVEFLESLHSPPAKFLKPDGYSGPVEGDWRWNGPGQLGLEVVQGRSLHRGNGRRASEERPYPATALLGHVCDASTPWTHHPPKPERPQGRGSRGCRPVVEADSGDTRQWKRLSLPVANRPETQATHL